MKVRLKNTETGKIEEFEPVDAREALQGDNSIYEAVPLETVAESGVDIPQMQGADAELQTGLSEDKYGRGNVVLAEPGDPDTARGDDVEGEPAKRARKTGK